MLHTLYSIAPMNTKYEKNPKLHLKDLYKFKSRLKYKILGEKDNEWRGELEFILSRTENKIEEVRSKLFSTRV
jgi:hypothetical protein